jgi:two-component system response regulator FlrC
MPNFDLSPRILVVDDEVAIREGLKSSLEQMGYDVCTADSGESALQQIKTNHDISFVLSDYRMPGKTGFDVLEEVKKLSPQTKFVLMTGYGSIHHAVEAMQRGADDYLSKPFQVTDLERIIQKAIPQRQSITTHQILTQDPAFLQILRKAERAAKSSAPILIEGPSGTGKELMARQIHEWSTRRDRSWVAINCAALPPGLLESELFGFERGAFTGAMEKKAGRFEQADGGTLLLDEIGELDPLLQAKLLRVLQEGEIDRLGGRKPQKVDVRIIATTNRNLQKLVAEGKFREDLYFRLYGVRFQMPSLNERSHDIPLIANEFLKRQSDIQGRSLRFDRGVEASLQARRWTGNVRELERAVERAAVLCESGLVRLEHFEFETFSAERAPSDPLDQVSLSPLGGSSMKAMEKEIIVKALEAHAGNRTHTAKALGMSLRTLRHKLKTYRDAGQFVPGTDLPMETHDAPLAGLSSASDGGERLA